VSHLYVDLSLYYTQIKRYLDIFPEKSVHIALYEDLNKSPQCFMDNIFSFLELRSITVNQQRRSNPSRKQRFPSIRKFSRKYNLTQYFSRDLVERIKRVTSVDDFPRLSQAEKKMIYETYFKDEMIKLPTLLKSKLNPLWRI